MVRLVRALVAGAFVLMTTLAVAQETRPRHAEILPPDWSSRDFEGRWHAYSKAIERAPSSRQRWLEALEDLREYAVIEWIAMTEAGFPGGDVLKKHDAPNWVRCAVWSAQNADKLPENDSHGNKAARALLRLDQGGVVRAWLDLYAPAFAETLPKGPTTPEDHTRARALSPPLSADDVFAGLSPPDVVLDFGTRTTAAPGAVYYHQIRRSLAALSFASRFHAEWLGRVAALTRHQDPIVRADAYLMFTMIDPGLLPVTDIIRTERDQEEKPEVREAALMALSFAIRSPTAWAEVHRVADDPAHPGFKTAVSRLGDLGDDFTLTRLAAVAAKPGADAAPVRDAIQRIGDRVVERSGRRLLEPGDVTTQLTRAAHLALTNDPMAATFLPWVKRTLADRIPFTDQGVAVVERVRDSFVCPSDITVDGMLPSGARVPAMPGEITASVRALAAEVLTAARTRPK